MIANHDTIEPFDRSLLVRAYSHRESAFPEIPFDKIDQRRRCGKPSCKQILECAQSDCRFSQSFDYDLESWRVATEILPYYSTSGIEEFARW